MRSDRGDALGPRARGDRRPRRRRGASETIDWTPPFRRLTMREAVVEFSRDDPRGAVTRRGARRPRRLLAAARAVRRREAASASAARRASSSPSSSRRWRSRGSSSRRSSTSSRRRSRRSPGRSPGDPEWVDRFELYAGGMEIANGFSELNDPAEQAARFRRQMEDRARGRPRGRAVRRGLRRGARVRHAADGGRGRRHRPADDAADGPALDPRRDPVSAAAAARRSEESAAARTALRDGFGFVALRYLAASRRRAHVALIATISIVGLAVGVAALIVSLALLSGLPGPHPRGRWRSAARTCACRPRAGRGSPDPERGARARSRRLPGVARSSPVVEGRGLGVGRRRARSADARALPQRARQPRGAAESDVPRITRLARRAPARRGDRADPCG